MAKTLVFIHGRAQQNKDSVALKREWVAAFQEGLRKSGLELPIAETDIRFPYYGDTLDQLVGGAARDAAAEVIIRGPQSQDEREFIRDVVEEIRLKANISDEEVDAEIPATVRERGMLNWAWVQGILKVIDRKTHFGSGASIALFTKDVYEYLTKPAVSTTINSGVLRAIRPGEPTVVVSHSLGTVVAYNVLHGPEARAWDIPLFVTVGSPLGVRRICQSIAPTTHPACARRWFNAFDERDVVALYPLKDPYFIVNPAITNKSDVKNRTDNRHGISGYLDDAVVARTIYDALV